MAVQQLPGVELRLETFLLWMPYFAPWNGQ